MQSYEKYPDNKELIGGKDEGILNLKFWIKFSIIFLGSPFIFFLLLPLM